MIKKIKYLIASLSLVLISTLGMGQAFANTSQDSVCQGIGLASTSDGCTEDTSGPTVNSTIRAVITILSFIVGAVSIIMVMVGGFKYVTSGGDSNKVASAKSTILYAIVGIVITVMAQVIVRFVLNKTSGPATTTTFLTVRVG